MSTSRIWIVIGYLIVVTVVWTLSVGTAELTFRILGDHPSADMKGLYASFGDGSYKLASRVDTSANWASGRFSVHTDGLGLRCDLARNLATKADDELDVLFVGDSQGFGNGVNYEDTIAGTVATAAAQIDWRIANTSVGGHFAQNQLELARWLRDQQRVKVANYVLLLTPGMATNCDSYNRAVVGEDGRLYDKPKNSLDLATIFLKRNSVSYSRLRDALRNGGIGDVPTAEAPWIFRIFGAGIDEKNARESLRGFLMQFQQFATLQGAKLVVVYVPLTVEIEFDAVAQAAATRGVALDRDFPLRICSSVTAELNLPLLSLRQELEKLHERNRALHLKGDYHYDTGLSKDCGLRLWADLKPILTRHRKIAASSNH
jgi:hypothetical protein